VNTQLIEFLIPLTIFITAVSNLFKNEAAIDSRNVQINYFFALFFGLIHGMGFSNYLRAILGKSHEILTPLLAFNLGLEFGQIIVVTFFSGNQLYFGRLVESLPKGLEDGTLICYRWDRSYFNERQDLLIRIGRLRISELLL